MTRSPDNWQRWLTAVTFAEAGEVDAARETLRPRRLLLLALRRGADAGDLLSCAGSLCRRVNGGLVTLWESEPTEQPPQALLEFADEARAQGLFHEVLRCEGSLPKAVVAYADAHPCVAFVVVDAASGWQSPESARDGTWKKLACPLVVAGTP